MRKCPFCGFRHSFYIRLNCLVCDLSGQSINLNKDKHHAK